MDFSKIILWKHVFYTKNSKTDTENSKMQKSLGTVSRFLPFPLNLMLANDVKITQSDLPI